MAKNWGVFDQKIMSRIATIDRQLMPLQAPVWRAMDAGVKRVSMIWHRRLGKDEVCFMRTRHEALKRPGNYWHLLPKQTQAKEAVWTAINSRTGVRRIDEMFPPAMRIKTNEQRMEITIPSGPDFKQQSIWSLKGSDSYDSLVGAGPVGTVFSEFPISDPIAWAMVKPMLEENGGWAMFNGTSRGKNHAYKQFKMAESSKDWFASLLPVSVTKALPQSQLDGIRAEYQALYGVTLGDSLYNQEYECSFDSAILGSVYGEAMTKLKGNGGIGRWPHIPSKRCVASFDIGQRDATVVWIYQEIQGEIRFVHCYKMIGRDADPDKVVKTLRGSDYDIAVCVLPHDSKHETASNRGNSYSRQIKDLGYEVVDAPSMSIEQGISMTRQMLAYSTFNESTCESQMASGITALSDYHYEYDLKSKILSRVPVHDWCSDFADSLRYAAISMERALSWLEHGTKNKVNVMQRIN